MLSDNDTLRTGLLQKWNREETVISTGTSVVSSDQLRQEGLWLPERTRSHLRPGKTVLLAPVLSKETEALDP